MLDNFSLLFTQVKTEFKSFITEAVSEAMEPRQEQSKRSQAMGDRLTEEEVMDILRRKGTWMHNKRKSGELPGVKIVGKWYYDKSTVDEYIKKNSK